MRHRHYLVRVDSAWYEQIKRKQDEGIGDGSAWINVMQVLFPDSSMPTSVKHHGRGKLPTYGQLGDHKLDP
jgi:hypothetical protein